MQASAVAVVDKRLLNSAVEAPLPVFASAVPAAPARSSADCALQAAAFAAEMTDKSAARFSLLGTGASTTSLSATPTLPSASVTKRARTSRPDMSEACAPEAEPGGGSATVTLGKTVAVMAPSEAPGQAAATPSAACSAGAASALGDTAPALFGCKPSSQAPGTLAVAEASTRKLYV